MSSSASTPRLLFLVGMATLGLLALIWAITIGPSEAQEGSIQNCPEPGKWAISVWSGDDATNADQAIATCSEGAVIAAYDLDPQTQGWLHWFADNPSVNTLTTLHNMQGIVTLGAAPTPTATPTTPPASVCNGLPTYSEVLATYPPDVELTISKFDIVAVIDGAWLTDGTIEARGGEDLVQWYGVQITIATSTPITIDGVTYQSGDKLTVDKDLNYVLVCSWD
jgi:hypothetical protein